MPAEWEEWPVRTNYRLLPSWNAQQLEKAMNTLAVQGYKFRSQIHVNVPAEDTLYIVMERIMTDDGDIVVGPFIVDGNDACDDCP